MMNYNRHNSRNFGIAMMLAAFEVARAPESQRENILEQAVEKMLRKASCEFCALDVPLNEQGDHEMLGLLFACDAAPKKPDFYFDEPAKPKSRKQAARLVTGRGVARS